MRILLICEVFQPPFDEGIRKFAWELIEATRQICKQVYVITKTGVDFQHTVERAACPLTVRKLIANKIFFSKELMRFLRWEAFNLIIYIPSSSGTIFSFIRAKIMEVISNAPLILILLQNNNWSFIKRSLVKFIFNPRKIYTQNTEDYRILKQLTLNVDFLPSGVDLTRFRPVSFDRKMKLRRRYSLSQDKKIILHVGHIQGGRGLEDLMPFQRRGIEVVIVKSTSFEGDKNIKNQLMEAGFTIIDRYLSHIEELYQLSDCYVFPVSSEAAAIGCPLSVLEAMACNLPVVTKKFGALPIIFPQQENGLFYFQNKADLGRVVCDALSAKNIRTRTMVEEYSWMKIAERLLKICS